MKRNNSLYFLLGFLLLISSGSTAQTGKPQSGPLLERVITISLANETLASSLNKIAEQGGFTFSYGTGLFDANRHITAQFTNKTVREILNTFFQGTIAYKERKKYVILTKAQTSSSETKQVSGYVVDEATGDRLRHVSVYDPVSMSSVITDDYGYFQMEVPKPSTEELRLLINKMNYADTVVAVTNNKEGLLRIPIRLDKEKLNTMADSVGYKMRRFWIATKRAAEAAVNMENISDTMYRSFQFSLIPFVGTNRSLSGNVINDYSLNLFGGYSLGVKKLEIGGLFNAVRGDVEGVQIAGLANGVVGKTNGVQLAGLFNANRDSVRAVQISGLVNFNYKESESVALAGLVNFMYENSRGVKVAGLGNVSIGSHDGPVIAGLFNFTEEHAAPFQLAGILNFANRNMHGAQVSGIINYAGGESEGAQVTGIINLAPNKLKGAQIGLLNFASHITGSQIGFLNYADSMKGTPVGFLSIVRNGYHKIEISADEVFYTNLSFRTGTHKFYTILMAGAIPSTFEQDKTIWTFGYGVGTAPKLSKKLFLNIDLTSQQIAWGNVLGDVNLINKLYLGFEFQAAKKLSLILGATLNGQVTDTTYETYPEIFTDYKPNIIYDNTYSNDINLKMWLGGKIGIRFL